jgi:hypothetical protein
LTGIQPPAGNSGGIEMKKLLILIVFILPAVVFAGYTLVVKTEPFASVYVNGIYAGMSDIDGVLEITLSSSGEHRITVRKSWYIIFDDSAYVSYPGVVVFHAPLKRAGMLRVYSNVYPVEVYSEDQYLGKVNSVQDTIYVPEGSLYITFKSAGFIPETRLVNISYAKETSVNISLIEEVLSINLKIEPEIFSPNGDWYQDYTTFYIYLSKPATLSIQVLDKDKKVVWQWSGKGKAGSNQINFSGSGISDGTYTVIAFAQTEKESFTATSVLTIDRSSYTYTKEIVLTTAAIAVTGLLFMFLISAGL